jgi:hypothetical protein
MIIVLIYFYKVFDIAGSVLADHCWLIDHPGELAGGLFALNFKFHGGFSGLLEAAHMVERFECAGLGGVARDK